MLMKNKGWFIVLLVLAMAVSCCITAAGEGQKEMTSGDWVYVRYGDTAVIVRYLGNESEIGIPDTLDGLPVTAVGEKYGDGIFTQENREQVVSVHIPDSVLLIGGYAFNFCRNLEKVNIPSHIATIQQGTFANTGLKSIELPPNLRVIDTDAFARTPLEEISFPASLEFIDRGAFESCTQLKEITWPNDDVILGNSAFWNTGIPEEKFSLPQQYADEDYTNRYRYYYPTEAVSRWQMNDRVSMDWIRKPDGTAGIICTYVGRGAPMTLTLPAEIDGLTVTGYYGDLNDWDEALETLVLPDTITEIGDMALRNLKVSKIVLPKKLVRIGHEALSYCNNLKELKLPESLRQIGYSSLLHSGADTKAFEDDVYQQLLALGINRPYKMLLGSIGHYYNYDVNLDGMICQVETDRENGEIFLVFCDVDASCTLRESPDSWGSVPFKTVPRDSIRIRDGIAYRDTEFGTLTALQVTDADGWDWTFPDTVDGMQVDREKEGTVRVMKDGLLCELVNDNGKQGIRILQSAAGWNGTIPETVGEYPVLWLGEEMYLQESGLVFCGYRYKEKMLSVCGCEAQGEEIAVPESVQGWTVYCVNDGAFSGLENLKRVTLPPAVQEVKSGAFTGCSALTEIDIQNRKASVFRDAFQGIGLKWLTVNDYQYSSAVPQGDGDYGLFADGTAELIHWTPGGAAIKIPAEIDGHPVISLGQDIFRDRDITSVEIPEGVIRIGDGAFYSCEKLSSVKLPDSLEYIGNEAFNNTKKLTSIKFPANLKYLGRRALSFTGLTTAVLPESLETIGDSAFYSCGHLTSVTLPEGLITLGSEVFCFCKNLKSVILPSTLQTIGDGCFRETKIKKIVIPASVQSVGDDCFNIYKEDTGWGNLYYDGPEVVFEGDPQVTDKTFGLLSSDPDYSYTEFWDRVDLYIGHKIVKLKITTSPGTMVDRIYLSPQVVEKTYPAESAMTTGETPAKAVLEAADIPQGVQILTVPEGVEKIAPDAFRGMHCLYKVILPESLKEIGDSAFENCGGLQHVIFGSGVEKIGARAFALCRNLREIALPEGITEIPESCFEKDINLLRVSLPGNLVSIARNAFLNCCYTEDVNLEACTSLESIGEEAFSRTGMRKVILPDSVRILGEKAFSYPTRMTDLKLSAGLEAIPDYCFYHCNHLKSLDIPGNIRSIGMFAFYQSRDLKDLKLSEGLESIGDGAFSTFLDNVLVYNQHSRRYTSLKTLKIPASVTKINIGAFAGMDALTSITFEKGSALEEIPEKCFMLCTGLKAVTVPGFIKKVGNSAFAYCTELSEATIEEGTTMLGGNLFMKCGKLKTLQLPASLTNMGENILDDGNGVTFTVTAGSFAETRVRGLYPKAKIKTRKE